MIEKWGKTCYNRNKRRRPAAPIKRMEQAKKLLTETDLPISEISLLAGYAEVNSFIKTFKNIESVTPAAYRSAHKQNATLTSDAPNTDGNTDTEQKKQD